jgi:hypothetical protein
LKYKNRGRSSDARSGRKADAAGLAALMAGARATQPDDDALLQAMTPLLDNLLAGLRAQESP